MSERTNSLTVKGDTIAGAITGITSRFCIAPLDVIKIKFQVQYGHYGKRVYQSYSTVIKDIYMKEGFTYFWNGNLAAEYLWCVYSAVQFSVVNAVRDYHFFKHNSFNTFFGGCLSAICSTALSYPFDLARTRMAAQSAHNTYNGVYKLLYSVYKDGHIKGLYTGLLPTLIQICPYTAINFTLYEYLSNQSLTKNHIQNSINGFISGIIAKICVYPLDTIKKQMQIRTMFEQSTKKSTYQILSLMYYKGGISSFYAGLTPSLLKSGISTSLCFGIYDYLADLFTKNNIYCK